MFAEGNRLISRNTVSSSCGYSFNIKVPEISLRCIFSSSPLSLGVQELCCLPSFTILYEPLEVKVLKNDKSGKKF
ncbi:hypothetical protein O3P69_003867 [Scylla paramamosain]|uniref:Uncharacterized protein n=1 Tax=Scylla paramamosain TaxID=85552 RepID=A0AAW0UJA3_SCYPA